MNTSIPKYIQVLAENIIFRKKKKNKIKMEEKEDTNTNSSITNTIYNPNLSDVYEILITEIINSLQQGQYNIVEDWNRDYKLRLLENIGVDISISENTYTKEKTIRSIKIESLINKPDLTTTVQDQIIEKLKGKSKEDEILELEVKIEKLNKQIQQLKGK